MICWGCFLVPVHPVRRGGVVVGFKWGRSGKLYLVKKYGFRKARSLALRQARAIYASGYKGDRVVVRKRRRDGVVQRYRVKKH